MIDLDTVAPPLQTTTTKVVRSKKEPAPTRPHRDSTRMWSKQQLKRFVQQPTAPRHVYEEYKKPVGDLAMFAVTKVSPPGSDPARIVQKLKASRDLAHFNKTQQWLPAIQSHAIGGLVTVASILIGEWLETNGIV